MPQPKPRKIEDKDKFIERCMEDNIMKDEYPDRKQRLAVCYDIWKSK